uniref:Uncharacterized protein n=1 Tax=Physcomitrium patens TaxID=3218 RepID=A0A7I4ES71_PHYPA
MAIGGPSLSDDPVNQSPEIGERVRETKTKRKSIERVREIKIWIERERSRAIRKMKQKVRGREGRKEGSKQWGIRIIKRDSSSSSSSRLPLSLLSLSFSPPPPLHPPRLLSTSPHCLLPTAPRTEGMNFFTIPPQ